MVLLVICYNNNRTFSFQVGPELIFVDMDTVMLNIDTLIHYKVIVIVMRI